MIIGTALYLAVLVRYLGRHRWWVTVAIALAAAGFNWLVFVHWLRVPMPEGTRCGLSRPTWGWASASRLTPFNLMMAVAGVLVGILIGALPGVGPPSGVAMLLPLTFGMDPTSGIIMLAALYAGTMYGGTITAVLINTPGESASVVTCLDGYQMALQGRAGPALGIAAIGSFIAGTIGVVLLMLMSPALARWSLSFGPPETFALMLLGLTTVTLLAGDDPLKGYISMVFGLMLAMVGYDIISGDARYGFGIVEMMDGIDFLPAAIGLFGLGEVLAGAEQKGPPILKTSLGCATCCPARRLGAQQVGDRARHRDGLPGRRAAGRRADGRLVPRLHVEKKVSKHPEQFGKGAIEGVAAPSRRTTPPPPPAMVPMLTLGIPGSATTAIMLGGLMMWGLRPGPMLFEKNPQFVWGLIASQYIANVMLLILSTLFIPLFVRAVRIPYSILMPLIVVFCVTGAYSLKNNLWDVGQMLVIGVLGYFMKKLGYSPAALVLALVLGPLAERALRQSLIISDAGIGILFMRFALAHARRDRWRSRSWPRRPSCPRARPTATWISLCAAPASCARTGPTGATTWAPPRSSSASRRSAGWTSSVSPTRPSRSSGRDRAHRRAGGLGRQRVHRGAAQGRRASVTVSLRGPTCR